MPWLSEVESELAALARKASKDPLCCQASIGSPFELFKKRLIDNSVAHLTSNGGNHKLDPEHLLNCYKRFTALLMANLQSLVRIFMPMAFARPVATLTMGNAICLPEQNDTRFIITHKQSNE